MSILGLKKHHLHLLSVQLECLDIERKHVARATGFIVRRKGRLFLHTCWHVVTGIEGWQPLVFSRATWSKQRRYLAILAQDVKPMMSDQGIPIGQTIGGRQELELSLYDEKGVPMWWQDKRHVPHEDLNAIHIRVPCWHDAVAFPLPETFAMSNLQVFDDSHLFAHTKPIGPSTFQGRSYGPGDRVFVVGYPYGFSTAGVKQPAALVLVRNVASTNFRREGLLGREVLLDGPCARGMSGSPVLVDTDDGLQLFGIYTSSIFPDNPGGNANRATALGVVTELTQSWGAVPLVGPSEVGSESWPE